MPVMGKKRPLASFAGPSLGSMRLAAKRAKTMARSKAADVEKASRAAGGYGQCVVTPWDLPPGGISKSPAWRLVVSRCGGGGRPPPPQERLGAPLAGGFPVEKWPPNVLVDGQRAFWLPDDWGQGVKNTGPGGTYIGWVSPEGKYFYHRPTINRHLGRELTARDGFNGILRALQSQIGAKGDSAFLREQLHIKERRHVLPQERFHFAVVSARRADSLESTHALMVVEAHFHIAGVRPTWYVDAESLDAYRKLGLDAIVGGKLTQARNMALDHAAKKGLVCVQVSDDISKWEYVDHEKLARDGEPDLAKNNAAAAGAKRYSITPLAAAQYLVAKMRSTSPRPRLGGVFPNANAALAIGLAPVADQHFILGDFFVADASGCRFDVTMTLKEDYDFTATHLARHGCIFRSNRLFVQARHATNKGGAVAMRDKQGVRERQNIAILQRKWPGVFRLNGRRKDEVVMRWGSRSSEDHTADVAITSHTAEARPGQPSGARALAKRSRRDGVCRRPAASSA